jgi:hypothetical protein
MANWSDDIEATIGSGASQAQLGVAASADDDPEKAARAMDLAQSSGFPASTIYGNLENFERFHKTALANQIVQGNPELQTYANSDPMATKVSADDWGALDAVSEKAKRLQPSIGPLGMTNNPIFEAVKRGFNEGFDAEGMEQSYKNLKNYIDSPWWRAFVQDTGFGGAAVALDASTRAFNAALTGASAGIGEIYKQAGGNEAMGNRLVRDLIPLANIALIGRGTMGGIHPEQAAQINSMAESVRAQARDVAVTIKPYLDAGEEPPAGLHPAIDKMKEEQNKLDLKNLDDLISEAQKSATRERNPELFQQFLEQHTDQDVSIPAEAVRKIYGDKEITPEDGKLGWVDSLQEQMEAAEPIGGDVSIPLAEYVTKIDPELHKELKDDLRIRQDGLTKNEAKELDTEPTPNPNPLDDARRAAALEPVVESERDQLRQVPVEPVEERELFEKAAAIGMTVDRYKRYSAAIVAQRSADTEAAMKRTQALETKRQTKEWKENRKELRPQVAASIRERADVAADLFFRERMYNGQLLKQLPKLSPEGLSDEAKAGLKSIIAKDGVPADIIGRQFGFQTGNEMAQALLELEKQRTETGIPGKAFIERAIDTETDRQMVVKYGKLDENILSDVRDQLLSDTQFDIMHEETLHLADLVGAQLPITKTDMRLGVKKNIGKAMVGAVETKKYLELVGKIGRAMEDAFLRKDYAEAFRLAQRKEQAWMYAAEAKKIERIKDGFEKLTKRFSAREVAGIPQEYTNFIHEILLKIGKPVKRSVQDLQKSIEGGQQNTLEDFVNYKEQHDLFEIPVAEFLFDLDFKKNFNALSVDDFKALNDSIKTLAKNGRDELKLTKQGDEADLNVIKSQMIKQLEQFKERHYDPTGKRWLGPIPPAIAKPLRTFAVAHLQLESLFNRWDKGDPRGVFTQYIARELAQAANNEAALERKYGRMLADTADKVNLKEAIPNALFRDPLTMDDKGNGGTLLNLNRGHLRAILLNMGNESNLDKLARGYGIPSGHIQVWARSLATKEDLAWVKKIGKIFEEIKEEADTMYRGLSGIEPAGIDLPEDGWYYPIIYHPIWEGKSVKLMGGDALEGEGYRRATTPAGYTKQRTGYTAPLALDIDQMPIRMRQMIHDIAMRPSIIQAGKIFYDKGVRSAIAKHYGAEYRELLIPYLKDVANVANSRSDVQHVGVQVSEFVRQNMIATLIGLNPGTVMKHGPTAAMNSITEVGVVPFLKAVKSLFSTDPETGESNWKFAMENSQELQRRHRHYNETLGGAQEKVLGQESMRQWLIRMGSYPVAISDLLSAVPTWLAKYESAMHEGMDHGAAVSDADTAVRRAHGSSVITSRPAIARGGAMASWFSSLYGFFSHILQRQYEMMWRAGDTLDLVKEGQRAEAMKQVPKVAGMFFSYVVFPAIVESAVQGELQDKEPWAVKAAKSLTHSLASSWVGLRDVASAAIYGRDPSAGLFSTAAKTFTDVVRDLRHDRPLGKQRAGMMIQHGTTAIGAATGLVNAQEGRVGRFLYDVHTGKEHPRGAWSWVYGLRHGTTKGFK